VGFQTDAIHAGQIPDPTTGAIMTPIYQTSTYVQDALGKHKGYEYARTGNPTRSALEKNIATLEGGKYGIAFASGLAAINALISLLKQGDHIVVTANVYGGTYRLFSLILKKFGLEFSFIDTSDIQNIKAAIRSNTRLVFIETPTNPMLTLSPLDAIRELVKGKNIITVADNTFMSPYFQNPLLNGFDLVIHSSTKYLNGHSDVVGGILITDNDELAEKLYFIQNSAGAVPGPQDCWLILRSTKTLALRMREHEKNALGIANVLEKNKKLSRVIYPGLKSHPQHDLARRQMRGFGGIISIDLGQLKPARIFAESLKIFALAESLGGVESLVDHPAIMTHASVPQAERKKLGITDGLIRLSVGIEDEQDLIQDIQQALNRAYQG
jgi:cystathionine beta-lyase/cystathionine gamma-synthase